MLFIYVFSLDSTILLHKGQRPKKAKKKIALHKNSFAFKVAKQVEWAWMSGEKKQKKKKIWENGDIISRESYSMSRIYSDH